MADYFLSFPLKKEKEKKTMLSPNYQTIYTMNLKLTHAHQCDTKFGVLSIKVL